MSMVESNGQLLEQFTINLESNKEPPHAICKYVVVVGGGGEELSQCNLQ